MSANTTLPIVDFSTSPSRLCDLSWNSLCCFSNLDDMIVASILKLCHYMWYFILDLSRQILIGRILLNFRSMLLSFNNRRYGHLYLFTAPRMMIVASRSTANSQYNFSMAERKIITVQRFSIMALVTCVFLPPKESDLCRARRNMTRSTTIYISHRETRLPHSLYAALSTPNNSMTRVFFFNLAPPLPRLCEQSLSPSISSP